MREEEGQRRRLESIQETAAGHLKQGALKNFSHFLLLTVVALGILAGQYFLFSDTQLPEALRYPHHIAAAVIIAFLFYLAFSDFVHRTLRVKLTVGFIMVASVPITFLAALDQRVAYEALTQNTRRALLGAASQTASSVDAFIRTSLDTIRTESLVPILAGYLTMVPEARRGSAEQAEAAGTLDAFRRRDSVNISSYALLDLKGISIVDTYGSDAGTNKSARDYFALPAETGLPYVSPVAISPVTGQPSIYFSSPVQDQNGRILGVLRARYRASVVQEIVFKETGRLGRSTYASLFDENFIRLADGSSPRTIFEPVTALSSDKVTALRTGGRLRSDTGEGAEVHLMDLAHGLGRAEVEPVFIARMHRHDPDDSLNAAVKLTSQPWWLVFSSPRRDFLATVTVQNLNAMVVLLLCVCGVLIASLVIVRKVSTPINQLTAVAEQVIAGDLTAAAEITTEDEIGRLATVFNAMTGRLREVIAALNERVAELQQAQDELRKSESEYRELVQSANSIILRMDTRGHIAFLNEFGQKFFGYTEQELLGRNVVGTIIPKIDSTGYNLEAKIEDLCAHPERYVTSSHESMRKDGERVWVSWTNRAITDAEGRLTELLWIGNDITERRQAEDARLGLVTAVEQATETIIITDAEGVIQYVNPTFERITGFSRDEAVGRTPRLLKSGKHDRAFYRQMWDTLGRGEVWAGHFINRHKNGGLYEEEATISPVRNAQGQIVSYVAVKRDVTDEVKWEMQLRQAQKMEAIGTLAGGIAHDFNNILTAIYGYAEMARYKTQEDSGVHRDLDQVLTACNRAKDLVRQILTFSRQGEQERKPVQLRPILKEALKLLRASLPSTIEINQDIALRSGEDRVLADPTQIHQVLMNLCSNAADAMRDSGGILEVTLDQQDVDEGQARRFPGLHPGRHVRMCVRDTGHGMDPEVMEHIFEPFYTTKGLGKGTGMGLAVVHGIVRNHNGAITVSSELGKGSVFAVLLPQLAYTVIEELRSDEQPLPRGHESILLVDDEPALVNLGRQMLESLGYRVTTKTSSLGALELFRVDPDRFDLVVTDMTMPQLTGAGLTRELLAIRPSLPIILCTGFSELIDAEKAKSLGIREYLMKPFVIRSMAEAVRRSLDKGDS
ncbi:MAG: PAS domain S-box protein [Syntrophobacteraceae bacterium]